MSGFELSALDPVFRAIKLADLDVVLVGGHAVSFYAVKYADRCPELLRYFPLLSKDADLIGTVNDGLRLAAALRLEWQRNPRKGGMQGLSLGQINLPEPPGAKLEILGKILGADAETIRESALNESRGDIKIRVIHPLLCKGCFTKTYARILASGLSALDPLLPEEVTARSSLSTVWHCLETT